MDNNNELFLSVKKEILGELRSDMNGAVVESMREYSGEEPFFSYGVTMPKIKVTVREYAPNHELAQELFNSRIRELKLAGIYMDAPESVTITQMEQWSESFFSIEIAENCGSMLFFAAPEALKIAGEWLGSDVPNKIKAALLMVGKRAKMKYSSNEQSEYISLIGQIKTIASTERPMLQLGIVTALTALYPHDSEYSLLVKEIMVDELTAPAVRSELEWRIDYL